MRNAIEPYSSIPSVKVMFFYGKVLATFLCIPMHEISLSVKVLT